jgi:hypothetical protein
MDARDAAGCLAGDDGSARFKQPNPGHQTMGHKKARKDAKTDPVFLRVLRFFAAKLPWEKSSLDSSAKTAENKATALCVLCAHLR